MHCPGISHGKSQQSEYWGSDVCPSGGPSKSMAVIALVLCFIHPSIHLPYRFILCGIMGGLEPIPAFWSTVEGHPERMASPSQGSHTDTHTHSHLRGIYSRWSMTHACLHLNIIMQQVKSESVKVKPSWRETGNWGGCLRSYPSDIHDLDRSELAGLNMTSLKRER